MICIPIVGASMPKALDQIAAAEKVADILELRLDLINSFNYFRTDILSSSFF